MAENRPRPPLRMPDVAEHVYRLALAIHGLLDGKHEATGTVTLAAGGTTTTLTDKRIGGSTVLSLSPTTANAAGALATTYVATYSQGSCIITHANNAQTDRTFRYSIGG